MDSRQWIKAAQANGWRLAAVKGTKLHLKCCKHGCEGTAVSDLNDLRAAPEPCTLPHVANYGRTTFREYEAIVDDLRRRRRQIGLDQIDLNTAMGMADGYVNKLESFARIATFPTLQLWAQTLGMAIALQPAALPPATIRAIDQRAARPYRPNQDRSKRK